MSLEPKTRMLLKELIAATEDQKVSWLQTTNRNGYRASINAAMVFLEKHAAEPGELCDWDDLAFVVKDNQQRTIVEYIPQEKEKQRELAALWNLAADLAQPPDEILDRVMQEIQGKRGVRPAV